MPPKSRKQQIAMIIAEKVKKGEAKAKPGTPSAKMAKSMSISSLDDFTKGSMKGLPNKVKRKK